MTTEKNLPTTATPVNTTVTFTDGTTGTLRLLIVPGTDYAGRVEIQLPYNLRIPGAKSYERFGFGISPAGDPGRKVFQGPMHEELFGYFFGRAASITAERTAPDPDLDLEEGDIIQVAGHGSFRVTAPRPFPHRAEVEVIDAGFEK